MSAQVSTKLATSELTSEQRTVGGCPHHAAVLATPAASQLKALPTDALETARATVRRENGGRTGILLVNHGSRSPVWRKQLLDVQAEVAEYLLNIADVAQVRTGFMEYTEPSIATQLREMDASGIERVLVVPLLLTISDHSFDGIPAICGQTDDRDLLARLASENIEVYRPSAQVSFAPLLDFSGLVRTNLVRRASPVIGQDPSKTGLVLVGYGSAEYDDDWQAFFGETRAAAEADLGIEASAHAWCGHLVDYRRTPTLEAINEMLERTDRVVVLPQLVSYDPMFQERLIGRAVRECADPSRVLYTNDAILPEPAVGEWVVQIASQMLGTVPV